VAEVPTFGDCEAEPVSGPADGAVSRWTIPGSSPSERTSAAGAMGDAERGADGVRVTSASAETPGSGAAADSERAAGAEEGDCERVSAVWGGSVLR
jgi:hypothetical protein